MVSILQQLYEKYKGKLCIGIWMIIMSIIVCLIYMRVMQQARNPGGCYWNLKSWASEVILIIYINLWKLPTHVLPALPLCAWNLNEILKSHWNLWSRRRCSSVADSQLYMLYVWTKFTYFTTLSSKSKTIIQLPNNFWWFNFWNSWFNLISKKLIQKPAAAKHQLISSSNTLKNIFKSICPISKLKHFKST